MSKSEHKDREVLVKANPNKKAAMKKAGHSDECVMCESRTGWMRHASRTREVGLVTITKQPEPLTKPSIDGLLQNQTEIGSWFGKVLDNAAQGQAVTDLLVIHIKQALGIVIALRDSFPNWNTDEIKRLVTEWEQNARDIANALAAAGKAKGFEWGRADLEKMLMMHLDLLTQQVKFAIAGQYQQSWDKYVEGENEIIAMSDAFVRGAHLTCECDCSC